MTRMTASVEVSMEARTGFLLDERNGSGEAWEGLAVVYRFAGQWRRRRFLLQAQPGTTLLELISTALLVVSLDREREPGDLAFTQGRLFDQAAAA